ncbi:MAG: antibiotic biosynthesis monooxygenase [Bacteroidetes bacterium]|nr:antibiotic biosynthesis monooxygenase [Bacteroidia bacterium]PCH68513.1 MAG: antibiotic biosynthesis monooxygenase [Bacteroidota bacterium]
MIKRIVKMTFQPDKVDEFLTVFDQSKKMIRDFPGCNYMELLRDKADQHVLFTVSVWDSVDSLDQYRNSEFFEATWTKTRALFLEKAEAWSLDVQDSPKDQEETP